MSTNLPIWQMTSAGYRTCIATVGSNHGSFEHCRYLWLGPDVGYLGWTDWISGVGLTGLGAAIVAAVIHFCRRLKKEQGVTSAQWHGRLVKRFRSLFGALLRDNSGNTLVLIAAGLLPLLGWSAAL